MQDLDPLELLIKANNGDKTSYSKLLFWIKDHSAKQLKKNLSRYFNFPTESIDDITQEVLITFDRVHQTFDTSRAFTPWLNAIISHKMIDFLRKKDFIVTMSSKGLEFIKGESYFESFDTENNHDVLEILKHLPNDQYLILKLSKVDGYSNKEIARKLQITESNVKVIIHRSIKFLKKLV